MRGISRDTVLAGRYALDSILAAREGLEHWSARDRTLDREVAVTVFAAAHPHADAALDGARRAAGVEDSRLVRILDVGRQGEHAYIVEEALHDATSLSLLLRDAPPAEEVRRIVGEAAAALEVARARGLHHLRLSPHAVLRTKEGGIRVSGLAVAGALEGADDMPSADASREDAVGLVALIYAGLTGTWPLEPAVPGLESARRLADGGVREPDDVHDDRGRAVEVPADLNTICRLTLRGADTGGRGDTGPRTPGELAHQLAPWASEQVRGSARSPGWAAGVFPGHDQAAGADAAGSGEDGGQRDDGDEPDGGGERDDDWSGRGDDRADDRLESPVPMLPGGAVAEPSGDQAKIALALVAAFVVVALLLAYCTSPLGGSNPSTLTTKRPTTTATTSTKPTASTTAPSPTSTAKEPSGPIKIASASILDPAANGEENLDTVRWTVDDSKSTAWTSWGTSTPDFNGKKDGVGLVFDLGEARTVHQATLQLPLPNGLTVYVNDAKDRAGATKLGSSEKKSGAVTIKADGTAPKGRYVIVWFTGLVHDTKFWHAALADIALK